MREALEVGIPDGNWETGTEKDCTRIVFQAHPTYAQKVRWPMSLWAQNAESDTML